MKSRLSAAISLVLALGAATFAAATPASSASTTQETLNGVVRTLAADTVDHAKNPRAFKGSSEDLYRQDLVVGEKTYVLHGTKRFHDNTRVVATGTVVGNDFTPTSISQSGTVAGLPDSGTTRVLVMLATWTSPDSMTQATAQSQMFSDTNSWYRDASYSALGQTGDVTPWLNIAGPTSGCYADNNQLMAQAKSAAVAAGYDVTSYDNFVLYFPYCAGDAAGFAGWAYVGASGTWLNGYMDRRVSVHEQGHNYGLWHSHSYMCSTGGTTGSCAFSDYGDLYDAMGSSGYVGHFNASQKSLLGWMSGRAVDLSAGGTTTLSPMAADGLTPHAAVVTTSSGATFWIEYRQATDFDSLLPSSGTDGVLIHVSGPGSGSPDSGASLIDVRPSDGINEATSTLRSGQSWTSPEGVVISAGAVSAAGATVTVNTGQGGVAGQPTDVAGVGASPTTAALTWAPPVSDGGSPITGYLVSRDGGTAGAAGWSRTVAATARSQTFTVLSPGSTYTLSVSAVNARGIGPAATVAVTVPAAAVPTVPTSLVGAATSATSATLTWAAPASVGGSAITGYRVAHDGGSAGGVAWSSTVAATNRSQLFTQLTTGVTYKLSVSAINSQGTGPAATMSVTPVAQAPGAPVSVSGKAVSSSSETLTWAPPSQTGGALITGYRVERDAGTLAGGVPWSTTVSATARTQTFTQLTPGSTYTLTVSAINAVGTGTGASVRVVAAVVPGPPVIGTATAGVSGGSITATAAWSPPTSNGGSPVTGYRIRALRMSSTGTVLSTTTSTVQPATARSLSMTLPQAGDYRFTAEAINTVGSSAQSARSNQVAGR